ncbi:hypothetical protein BDZ85DRAFT_270061 [Elsinoe ampelina]|uniref:Prolyl 4-hydroxylase alpha subunit Fe(2+) 2OG dioxygenase domain-containing protein n=1 Tax=Elsinoe ampelina TaxID=302913 RepID=A0A6A6FYQ0_9PEZI|nr:hypothetical protein BDZ85DRAFT_270061 [Elsinoe ampelina]
MAASTSNERPNPSPFQILKRAIKNDANRYLFACGGSVAIKDLTQSLALRYDTTTAGTTAKLNLPAESTDLDDLIAHCQPATFGYQGKDVLDTSYREAIKMDPDCFSINLSPYDLGCVQAIIQLLRPSTTAVGQKRIRAELYKLNIYSGPSGKFKAHVDTPRGEKQFGCLVICLPCSHQGGSLEVRHLDHKKTFDWASESKTAIQWAAFYSDCEHEVQQVTSGHRVTLTYNLYDVDTSSDSIAPALRVEALWLLKPVSKFLKSELCRVGGLNMCIHLTHAYAHNRKDTTLKLPHTALKGIDSALYEVFTHLGLKVQIRPVLDCRRFIRGECLKGRVERAGGECPCPRCTVLLGDDFHDVTGEKLHQCEEYNDYLEVIQEKFPHKKLKNFVWLNKPVHKECAITAIAYGNEASVKWMYSSAAMVVELPPVENKTEDDDAKKSEGNVHDKKKDGGLGH